MLDGNQAALFAERQKGTLPGELGIEWTDVRLSADVGLLTPQRVPESGEGDAHGEREQSFERVG